MRLQLYKLSFFLYISLMEKLIDKAKNPFIEDSGEKPSADYLAWVDQEIQKGLDQAEKHPDKMIPHHEIRKDFGLEY